MAESAEARRVRTAKILARLSRAYPDVRIELRFKTPFQLLVATILSAQCTDERVNAVTATLFDRYQAAEDLAQAHVPTLEQEIHSTGFFKAKARSLVGMGRALVDRHGGDVPRSVDELMALPGVGRKTANVVLGNAFGIPALAVDTHVTRVSQRLGLTRADEPERIHDDLCALVPKPRWTRATHLLIIHGRRTCRARMPDCPHCPILSLCPWRGKPRAGRGRVRPRGIA